MNYETHESCKATFNNFSVLRGSQEFEVFFVNENALVACFDSGVDEAFVKELAGIEPLRVVYRDNSFASDTVKVNVEQTFKQLPPSTEIKSI